MRDQCTMKNKEITHSLTNTKIGNTSKTPDIDLQNKTNKNYTL